MKFNSNAYDKVFPREEVKKPIVTEDEEDSMVSVDENIEETIEEKPIITKEDEGGTDDGITGTSDPSSE